MLLSPSIFFIFSDLWGFWKIRENKSFFSSHDYFDVMAFNIHRHILNYSVIITSISLFTSCHNTPKIEDHHGTEYERISQETIDSLRAIVATKNCRKDSLKRDREIADSLYFKKLQQDYFDGKTSTTDYAHDGHPGTKPDDPMFGFDPWDDWDDAYNLERNDIDPYPEDW